MRNTPNVKMERYRIGHGPLRSDASYGNNGAFDVPGRTVMLFVIVSDEEGWDHVSVQARSNPPRLPTWEEMCLIKDLFFKDDETVVQYHPKKSEYVNHHPWVLHLWRKQDGEHELPPSHFVGPKSEESSRGTL